MSAAKKATQKKISEKWTFMDPAVGESYTIYKSRDAAVKAAKEEAADTLRYNETKKQIKYLIFKLDSEIVFDVEVKEVPVMTKTKVLKERK